MTNIEFDEEGYLLDLSQWSEALAESIATKEGLELTEAHWEILRVLRNFYEQFEVSQP